MTCQAENPRTTGLIENARIVGDTMGKYHPHMTVSVIEALVSDIWELKRKDSCGRPWKFGSMGGVAHVRYTEARLEMTQGGVSGGSGQNVVRFCIEL